MNKQFVTDRTDGSINIVDSPQPNQTFSRDDAANRQAMT
jgi:hypothetical protein